jgi:chromosome partitioning protein
MVIAVANQKGGVGKTTSAINLAVLLSRRGRGVLAVDVDPQFALTRRLGVELRSLPSTVVDVLAGWTGVGDAIVRGVHGLDVLPGSRELAGVELALAGEVGRESVLREALDGLGYDQVVIDTPSNLGLLTVNALVAADVVVAPVAAGDEGAAQGLAELRATIVKLSRISPIVPELTVIVTKTKPRRVMTDVIDDAITRLGLSPVARIPDRTAVEQADVSHTPIAIAAPDSAVALAYEKLADHLENRAAVA